MTLKRLKPDASGTRRLAPIPHSSGMGARRVKDQRDQGLGRFPTETNAGQTTYIANRFLRGVRSYSNGTDSTLMEPDAKVLRLPIVLEESSGLFSNCSITGGGPERFTIDGSRQSDTVALFPALVTRRACVSTWCRWRGDGRMKST